MPPSIPTIPRDSSPRRSALRVGVALGVAIVSVVAIVVVVFYAASPPADISPTPDTSTNTAKMNSSGRQNGSSSRDTTPATAKSGRAATLSDRRDADWRKIDNPGGDGWETEVFHSRAKKQLGKLAELLASGDAVAAEKLSPLLASDFSCSALRPETLQTAFNESGLYVQRGASSDAKAFRTVDGLREALHRLTSTMNQSTTRRIKFKIFRVTEDADQVTTRQYVSIVAPTPAGIVEQHATWQIHWAKATAGQPPKLRWIGVEDFEETTLNREAGPLLVDCTRSVLGENTSYEAQLLRGLNYWLSRVEDTTFAPLFGRRGIAVGDVNGDGLDDLYLCQEIGRPNLLFIQNADGTARDASAQSGVNYLEGARSALLVDLDNDGDQDLAIAIIGGVVLTENDGTGRFTLRDVLSTGTDTMCLSGADYDNDGDLDLYVGAYEPNNAASLSSTASREANVPSADFVYHDNNAGGPNQLFRNDLAERLRSEGHDVLRAMEAGQSTADDAEILHRAIDDGRILVTLDEHFGDWAVLPLDRHCGVVRMKIHPTTTVNAASLLIPFLEAHDQEQFRNRLIIITPGRERWITTATK